MGMQSFEPNSVASRPRPRSNRARLRPVERLREPSTRNNELPRPPQDSCILSLQLGGFRSRDLWRDGQLQETAFSAIETADLVHVKFEPAANLPGLVGDSENGLFGEALIEIQRNPGAMMDSRQCAPGFALHDPIVRRLEACLLQGLEFSRDGDRHFLDHVVRALHAHCVKRYGDGTQVDPPSTQGRLAPWQERRAKEFMDAHLHEEIYLSQVARECKLSSSHFARAFRRSTGLPPHRWLLGQRVERAKRLMVTSMLPLAEIALACGFADQSHLSRVFTQKIGTTPNAWRRAQDF